MTTATAPVLDTPAALAAALHAWLLLEAEQHTVALRWTEALGKALIAADLAAIQTAQEALHRWEVEHLPQLEAYRAFEARWEAVAGARPFSVSQVVQWLQSQETDTGWDWQLAEAAGQLQLLVRAEARQSELNQLLIAQHADILQQTWMLFAQVLTGTNADERRYDDLGQTRPVQAGATMLDARG